MSEEEKKKSIEKIEKWLRKTSSLISEKVYGQESEEEISGQVSEEEKQAIESLRKNRGVSFAQADIISNLINKQQKEIESNKQRIDELNFRYNIEHSKNLSKKELIDQQQKEIEELKERQDYARLEKEQLLEDSISKDKIREKIKELEELKEKYFEKQIIQGRIDLLQELLEE